MKLSTKFYLANLATIAIAIALLFTNILTDVVSESVGLGITIFLSCSFCVFNYEFWIFNSIQREDKKDPIALWNTIPSGDNHLGYIYALNYGIGIVVLCTKYKVEYSIEKGQIMVFVKQILKGDELHSLSSDMSIDINSPRHVITRSMSQHSILINPEDILGYLISDAMNDIDCDCFTDNYVEGSNDWTVMDNTEVSDYLLSKIEDNW